MHVVTCVGVVCIGVRKQICDLNFMLSSQLTVGSCLLSVRQMNLFRPETEPKQDRNLVSSPQSRLWCTHRLCAGEGDVPDLLRDELQLGVVPLPLPLLPLQARDHLRPGHRHLHDHVTSYSYSYLLDFKSWIF